MERSFFQRNCNFVKIYLIQYMGYLQLLSLELDCSIYSIWHLWFEWVTEFNQRCTVSWSWIMGTPKINPTWHTVAKSLAKKIKLHIICKRTKKKLIFYQNNAPFFVHACICSVWHQFCAKNVWTDKQRLWREMRHT